MPSFEFVLKQFGQADLINLAREEKIISGLKKVTKSELLRLLTQHFHENKERRDEVFPDCSPSNNKCSPLSSTQCDDEISFLSNTKPLQGFSQSALAESKLEGTNELIVKILSQQNELLLAQLPSESEKFKKAAKEKNLRFSGGSGNVARHVVKFISEAKQLVLSHKLQGDDAIQAVCELLEGSAKRYVHERLYRILTLDDLFEALKENFVPSTYDSDVLLSLLSRTQGRHEPVDEYISCMLALNKDLENSFNDKKMTEIISKGLNPNYLRLVQTKNITSLSELEAECRHVKNIFYLEKKYNEKCDNRKSVNATQTIPENTNKPKPKETNNNELINLVTDMMRRIPPPNFHLRGRFLPNQNPP